MRRDLELQPPSQFSFRLKSRSAFFQTDVTPPSGNILKCACTVGECTETLVLSHCILRCFCLALAYKKPRLSISNFLIHLDTLYDSLELALDQEFQTGLTRHKLVLGLAPSQESQTILSYLSTQSVHQLLCQSVLFRS